MKINLNSFSSGSFATRVKIEPTLVNKRRELPQTLTLKLHNFYQIHQHLQRQALTSRHSLSKFCFFNYSIRTCTERTQRDGNYTEKRSKSRFNTFVNNTRVQTKGEKDFRFPPRMPQRELSLTVDGNAVSESFSFSRLTFPTIQIRHIAHKKQISV